MSVGADRTLEAARTGAVWFPRSENGLIEITGADREEYLNSLCTNRVVGLEPGEATRAFMLNPTKGRVLADFLVVATDDALWLECEAGCGPAVLELLQRYYFGQDVVFEDRSAEWDVGSLQGAESETVAAALAAEIPEPGPGSHLTTGIGVSPVRLVRWSDTGLPGFHVWYRRADADAIAAALDDAGVPEGTGAAWTVLQIEGGVAAYGRELTDEVIPLEAPTENAISHEKGCYPGQEVIARLWARGRPAKHLRGLKFDGGLPPPGTSLDADDKPSVATVTASGVSPEAGPVGLAYVKRDYCEPGTRLSTNGIVAEVVDLPIVPGRA